SMDIFTIADKGLVFTSDKDKNILNKIELHNIYSNDAEVLTTDNSMYDVKNLFLTTSQTFIPIINEERNVLGIIYLNDVRSILFNNYKLSSTSIETEMKPPFSVSLSENTGNALQLIDENHLSEILVTQQDKLIGYVTKVKILEVYRENLKNLRIE
ncbi:MAG: CBS domain-containing protein, partial [Flavobacterium sp.]